MLVCFLMGHSVEGILVLLVSDEKSQRLTKLFSCACSLLSPSSPILSDKSRRNGAAGCWLRLATKAGETLVFLNFQIFRFFRFLVS